MVFISLWCTCKSLFESFFKLAYVVFGLHQFSTLLCFFSSTSWSAPGGFSYVEQFLANSKGELLIKCLSVLSCPHVCLSLCCYQILFMCFRCFEHLSVMAEQIDSYKLHLHRVLNKPLCAFPDWNIIYISVWQLSTWLISDIHITYLCDVEIYINHLTLLIWEQLFIRMIYQQV